MYITNSTENVRELIEKLDDIKDISKMRFLLYIFNLLNNDQINSKNEVNPKLVEDEELDIFNFPAIGFAENYITTFLQYNVMVYNIFCKHNNIKQELNAYEEEGNVFGIEYDDEDKELISLFEKLSFEEKIDIFKEVVIKYDNETYFRERITMLTFDSDKSGYDIARLIDDYKNKTNK